MLALTYGYTLYIYNWAVQLNSLLKTYYYSYLFVLMSTST